MALPPSTTSDLPASTTTTTMASTTQAHSSLPLNPWEVHALNYVVPDPRIPASQSALARPQAGVDPLIRPGLYSATGFDLLSILISVRSRPNPVIDIGAVDCSVAVVVCDLDLPDEPIVYASDAFYELTGYSENEVLGRNCRFLQRAGPGSSPAAVAAAVVDKPAARRMHHAIHSQYEIQLQVHNYKRNGQPFTNILSIIPIQLASNGRRYAVGFQSELQ